MLKAKVDAVTICVKAGKRHQVKGLRACLHCRYAGLLGAYIVCTKVF